MKIHTTAKCLTSSSEFHGMSATSELPEGAANVTATHVVLDTEIWQVVTWLELSPSERAEALMAAHRGRGIG